MHRIQMRIGHAGSLIITSIDSSNNDIQMLTIMIITVNNI